PAPARAQPQSPAQPTTRCVPHRIPADRPHHVRCRQPLSRALRLGSKSPLRTALPDAVAGSVLPADRREAAARASPQASSSSARGALSGTVSPLPPPPPPLKRRRSPSPKLRFREDGAACTIPQALEVALVGGLC